MARKKLPYSNLTANGIGITLGVASGVIGYALWQNSSAWWLAWLPPLAASATGGFVNNSFTGFTRQIGLGTSWSAWVALIIMGVGLPAVAIKSFMWPEKK